MADEVEEYNPRYPMTPLPVKFAVGTADSGSGQVLVAVTFIDTNGERVYFIGGQAAVRLGAAINAAGREALIQESLKNPKLIMPNGQAHIVRPPDDGGASGDGHQVP